MSHNRTIYVKWLRDICRVIAWHMPRNRWNAVLTSSSSYSSIVTLGRIDAIDRACIRWNWACWSVGSVSSLHCKLLIMRWSFWKVKGGWYALLNTKESLPVSSSGKDGWQKVGKVHVHFCTFPIKGRVCKLHYGKLGKPPRRSLGNLGFCWTYTQRFLQWDKDQLHQFYECGRTALWF